MSISVVQRGTGHDGGSGQVAVAFGSNNTAGNTIIVPVVMTDTTNVLFQKEMRPPTDTNGNIYYNISDLGFLVSPGAGIRVYAAYNIKAGANTVTVTDNSNVSTIAVYEVAGLATYAAFDKSAVATNTSTTSFSSGATATTSFANELLLGVFFNDSLATYTVGSGYSNIQTVTFNPYFATEEQIVSSTGTYTATATTSASATGLGGIVTFADTGQVSPTTTVTRLAASMNTTSGTHSASGTPAVNDLIVIVRAATGNTVSTAPTDNNSDGNGTYTLVTSALKNTSADLMEVWVRNSLVGSAASTTFTESPGTTTGGGLVVFKIVGMSVAGSSAIVQSATQANQSANTVPAPAFTNNITSPNAVIGAVFNATSSSTNNVHAPVGFAENAINGYSTPTTGLETVFNNGGSTGKTITWDSQSPSAFSSVIVEIGSSATPYQYSDTTTTSESIQVEVNSFVNQNDPTNTTEQINPNVVSNPVLSDSTSTSESISVQISTTINVSDSSTTSESKSVALAKQFSVSDTIFNQESVQFMVDENIAVSDSTSITETVVVSLPSANTDVVVASDSTSTSESISLQESVAVSVLDTATTSESIALTKVDLEVESDTVTTSESISILITNLNIGVSDTSATSESITALEPFFNVITSDSSTTSESKQVFQPFLSINKSDSITNNENVAVNVPLAGVDNIVATDSSSTSENMSLFITGLRVSKSDTATISENVALGEALVKNISVSDTSVTSENVNPLEYNDPYGPLVYTVEKSIPYIFTVTR